MYFKLAAKNTKKSPRQISATETDGETDLKTGDEE